jgi:hypothetical protein
VGWLDVAALVAVIVLLGALVTADRLGWLQGGVNLLPCFGNDGWLLVDCVMCHGFHVCLSLGDDI